MAPAVRVDLFRQQLEERVGKGKGIEKLAMYTMEDGFEKNDTCGPAYRKSLLYLIYKALEPRSTSLSWDWSAACGAMPA
jgi:hypothetical protein